MLRRQSAQRVNPATLAAFVGQRVIPQSWWEVSRKLQTPRFNPLQTVFQLGHLEGHFLRLGTFSGWRVHGAIDVFIVGRTADGDVVGLSTISLLT